MMTTMHLNTEELERWASILEDVLTELAKSEPDLSAARIDAATVMAEIRWQIDEDGNIE